MPQALQQHQQQQLQQLQMLEVSGWRGGMQNQPQLPPQHGMPAAWGRQAPVPSAAAAQEG
jgi:hypothetical protein